MEQLSITDSITARNEAMASVEAHAGAPFREQAQQFVLDYLKAHGATSGEDLTTACVASGIKPHDERAFGAILMSLSRNGKIIKVGTCMRVKGHGTSGGNIWDLATRDAHGLGH
mgnify:CR=1 FL=1